MTLGEVLVILYELEREKNIIFEDWNFNKCPRKALESLWILASYGFPGHWKKNRIQRNTIYRTDQIVIITQAYGYTYKEEIGND